jgi:hypothetical protein
LIVGCMLLAIGAGAAQLSGVVTNVLTTDPVEGVAVVLDPDVAGEILTGSDGSYAADVPSGSYSVSFEDVRFEPRSEPVDVMMNPVALDVGLTAVAPVLVSAEVQGTAVPGAALTATASVEILDGSTLQSFAWSQTESVTVQIDDGDTDTATVTLPGASAYKDELITVLESPPIREEDLPPNVELPEGGFVGGLQDRYQVVGINPFALENAGLVTLRVTVTTSTGMYSDEVEIHATLPWKPASGVPNVPIGIPVLMHAKDLPQGSGPDYDWSLDLGDAPGSSAALVDATTQSPWFVPDVEGVYTLTVGDVDPAATGPVSIDVYASGWIGAITGQDQDGHPVSDDCTICHNEGPIAPDNFTPWSQTGHARIFSDLLNTSGFYNEGCFSCHSVGYDPEVDNGGFDDASDYDDFLNAGLLGSPDPDNWTTMLNDHPATGRKANAQCENCHGPLVASHANPSISIAAENCGTCHGEPLRHARYQQWQLSRHANYELAEEEGLSGSCARCHTGNGFLAWLPVLLGEEEGDPSDSVPVTWSVDEIHPQTCVTCHDPHSTGTKSGIPTDATVRISDDTPLLLAGFVANDVGRGAVCMTCHNTRRGLRNDGNFGEIAGTSETSRSPHQGAQADMLMGQNAYLVTLGRGSHSTVDNVQDTCVTCHMEATPPPGDLSYNQGGTNHTFFASPGICGECHFGLPASAIQGPVEDGLNELQGLQEQALLDLIALQNVRGRVVDLNGQALIDDAGDVQEIVFGEFRGSQSITVTLPGGTFGPFRMPDVDVREQDGTLLGQLYDFASPHVAKAGWNWGLVHNDGSRGVHNPTFANLVLDASIEALQVPEPGKLVSQLVAAAALGWLASRRRDRGARS